MITEREQAAWQLANTVKKILPTVTLQAPATAAQQRLANELENITRGNSGASRALLVKIKLLLDAIESVRAESTSSTIADQLRTITGST